MRLWMQPMLSKKREIPMDSEMFQPVTGNRAATLDATSAQTGALRREIEAAGPYDDILDHCCFAWNKLVDRPWTIMSIGLRDWAHRF
jgi:hypothetical protein